MYVLLTNVKKNQEFVKQIMLHIFSTQIPNKLPCGMFTMLRLIIFFFSLILSFILEFLLVVAVNNALSFENVVRISVPYQ